MKQLVLTGPRKSRVIDVPVPQINSTQLLVKVAYTGMCHSEWYPWTVARGGETPGHESVGVVAEVGKDVQGFKAGDRVTGLAGGTFKEYIVMEPAMAVHVPDGLADVDALGEPLACMFSAGERMMPALLGDSIAVVGAGYMGLGMIALFKTMGYKDIVAIDLRDQALENAKRFGATETYRPDQLPREYRLSWETWGKPGVLRDGRKADIFNLGFQNVMEFTGTESGLRLASELVCAHGRLGIGGYHMDGPRTLDMKLWNIKAMTAINAHERRTAHLAALCKRGIELLGAGLWKFTGVTNHIYSMEEYDKANEEMDTKPDNYIKAVVKC